MELCTQSFVINSAHLYGAQVKNSQKTLLWFQMEKFYSAHYDSEGYDLISPIGHMDMFPQSALVMSSQPGTQSPATGIRNTISGLVTLDPSLRSGLILTKQARIQNSGQCIVKQM